MCHCAGNDVNQLMPFDGLGEVGAEADLEAFSAIFIADKSAESDGGDIGRLADLAEKFPAADFGQADVADEEIEFNGGECTQGFIDRSGAGDVLAIFGKDFAENVQGIKIVFDNENFQFSQDGGV